MATTHFGPFDLRSVAAGLIVAACLLLIVAFFGSNASFAIFGLFDGFVAAGALLVNQYVAYQRKEVL